MTLLEQKSSGKIQLNLVHLIMKKFLIILILSLLSSGNVNAAPQDGTGELKLSYNVVQAFMNYIRGGVGEGAKSTNNKPMVFYVTEDGSMSYFWYCPYGQCQGGKPSEEMKMCKAATGLECKRFARAKSVRWKNGVNPAKGKESKFHEKMTDSEMIAKLTKLGFYGNNTSSNTKKTKTTESADLVKKLKELNNMLESGVISAEEFKKAKEKLLN